MDKIITIIGPTASGKTSLAIQLSKELEGEVISLDSRQIYKGMGIGTAQPTIEEMMGVKHHLIGCIHPKEPVSAGRYAELVIDKVALVQKNGKIPIICGGAGLYYRAIKTGIFSDSITDVNLRNELESSYDDDPNVLLKKLEEIDPEYASIVHINNKKRLVRALEIFGTTGKAPSINYQNQKSNPTKVLDLFTIRLDWDRKNLNKRINQRLDFMLSSGWIDEVNDLVECERKENLLFPALNTIGYGQIKSFLKNDISFEKMKENIFIKTRQFAKRQNQWFNNENTELTINMDNLKIDEIIQILCGLVKVMI
jgi:tRNA dimethylallyltransferase